VLEFGHSEQNPSISGKINHQGDEMRIDAFLAIHFIIVAAACTAVVGAE
jgi:hypothetical protein